jgi:hypothetical protein
MSSQEDQSVHNKELQDLLRTINTELNEKKDDLVPTIDRLIERFTDFKKNIIKTAEEKKLKEEAEKERKRLEEEEKQKKILAERIELEKKAKLDIIEKRRAKIDVMTENINKDLLSNYQCRLLNQFNLRRALDYFTVKDVVKMTLTCKFFYRTALPEINWTNYLYRSTNKKIISYEETKENLSSISGLNNSLLDKHVIPKNTELLFPTFNPVRSYPISMLLARTYDLNFYDLELQDSYFRCLLQKFPALKETVTYFGVPVSTFNADDYNFAVNEFENIRTIDIRSCNRENIQINKNSITNIRIGCINSKLLGSGMFYLRNFRASELLSMDITGLGVVGEFIQALAQKYPKLEKLILKQTVTVSENFDNEIGKNLDYLKSLKYIDISDTTSTGLCLTALHSSNIEHILMSNNKISPIVITAMTEMNKLSSLDISGCVLLNEKNEVIDEKTLEITTEFKALIDFISNSNIITLTIGGYYVTETFVMSLLDHKSIKNLIVKSVPKTCHKAVFELISEQINVQFI